MSCDLGFSVRSSIALIAGLFGLLAVVGDQSWLASLEAKESANSEPDLVAYFVSWHVTEHGSSSNFQYTGSPANPQAYSEERTHSMNLEMTGSAIERYRPRAPGQRVDNGPYFDIRFITVTLRDNDNNWLLRHGPEADCTITHQERIVDPGAYSGFRADGATSGVAWDLLGGVQVRDARVHMPNSFTTSLSNMGFTKRYTLEQRGAYCNLSESRDERVGGEGGSVFQPQWIIHDRWEGLEADSADRTSFSLNRQFTYIATTGGVTGGGNGDERRYVTWTAHSYRMGKCAAHDPPIEAGDPIIEHEQVDIDTDRPVVDANTSPGADSNIANLKIRVTCEGVPVEKEDVDITVEAQDQSGGHLHSDDERPRGTIDGKVVTKDSVSRTTNANGEVKLKYGAPLTGYVDHANYGAYKIGIAGTYKVTAKSHIPDSTGTVAILAKVEGLVDLPANPYYVVARGDTGGHPDGSYGTPQTLHEFGNLANDFYQTQQDHNQQLQQCQKPPWTVIVMSLNDIALPDGGIFDWQSTWQPSHQTHNRGEGGDFNKFKDVPWSGPGATATDCDEMCVCTTVRKRAWLLHTLMWLGQSYGYWDCTDLGHPPGCEEGEPPNSVGYIMSHPAYPPNLHLHVQD